MLWVFFFLSSSSTFSLRLSPCPPFACFSSRCVVMSWVHCCPARLIKADNKTGWLHYGSNEICQRRLHSRARGAATPLILALHRGRGDAESWGGEVSWVWGGGVQMRGKDRWGLRAGRKTVE